MDISVIIPFYNTGEYIHDTIKSIQDYKGKYSYEVILIDDGSDDINSIETLNNIIKQHKFKLIRQANKGANAARNAGCKVASGDFLFFLDSDNKMMSAYWDDAMQIFEANPNVGVVYSKPIFFGDQSRPGFETDEFDIDKILNGNYIDMCSMVRTEAWKSVEGFDENKELNRLQDWEFWLNLFKHGWQFHYLSQPHFEYRIRKDSIGGKSLVTPDNRPEWYIRRKHVDLLFNRFKKIQTENTDLYDKLQATENIIKTKNQQLKQKEHLISAIKHSDFIKIYLQIRNAFSKNKIVL
ncbi:glycosyltransferase family 2 protein [Rhizosphaericola mali]|uniref:Glycosyltransferase family 2 protein n=1 Tax=Rhizosphaericola mali TaxID=2545455 RepID=A0A5P2G1H2_9BACT|nr:glycosyltransferase family A protein [Rhizosphaericola mali]QES87682.1 glycosyltransferase family 2 protein [Rhizosphaericola mali]